MTEEDIDFIKPTAYDNQVQDPVQPSNLIKGRPTGKIFTTFVTFKAVPFFLYLFSGLIFSSSVFQWVLVIVSSAVDFWFTKNVAGRLILGMRWTNVVDEDGQSTWKFEYAKMDPSDKANQRRYFWIILFGAAGIWALFSFFSVIRLNLGWLFVTGIACALAGTNAWGFWKCDKSIKEDVKKGASDIMSQTILPFLIQSGKDIVSNQAAAIANPLNA